MLVLAIGIVLRVWFMLGYRPAFLGYADSAAYVRSADVDLFGSSFRPAGYPAFLRLAHFASSNLSFTIALQHALGVGTAALLYASVRRVGGPRWAALLPAVAVVFDGLTLFLEHAVLSESVFDFAVAAALYAAVRGLDAPSLRWSATGGIGFGVATSVRPIGIALVAAMTLWRIVAERPRRAALAPAAAICLAAGAVVGVYQAVQVAQQGQVGLTRASGWFYYGRVAPFADCRRFRPPVGTRRLCESTPASRRGNADHYIWDPDSPARRLFRIPKGNARLGAFARAAVTHQPLDYVRAVARDLVSYVKPDWGPRGLVYYLQNRRDERMIRPVVASYYDFGGYHRDGAEELSHYATQFNVSGWPTAILIGLAVLAPFLARGRARAGALAFAGTAVVLLVAPVLTLYANARYAVPALGPFAAGAALMLDALVVRWRGRARHRPG